MYDWQIKPWWKRWWAIVLYLLLGLLVSFIIMVAIVMNAIGGDDYEDADYGFGDATWSSAGCDEPEPLVVISSDALETDVGLAADSLATIYDISVQEASRRLRLQQVLGERMAEVRVAEAGRVARSELQHQPYFSAVVTLTGTTRISDETIEILCRTPELEVRLGALFTEDELVAETNRLAQVLQGFGPDLTSFGPGDGRLEFTVIDDAAKNRLDDILSTGTEFPYLIESLGIPPLVLDPAIPFPLLDVTGKMSSGVGLEGILTIEGPCVYLGDALVILPARETTWNPDTGVLNTGSGDIRSGDRVTGGGNDYRGPLEDLDQPPAPSCRVNGGVLQASFAPINQATNTAAPTPAPAGTLPGLRVHPALSGPAEVNMAAVVQGVLEISDGCVWLAADGGVRYPVIWPTTTTGQADPAQIMLPDGQIAMVGDRVQGGGGYLNGAQVTESLGLVPFPSGCTGTGETAVFNANSPVHVDAGVGVPVDDTLVERFSLPNPIGLELIAVMPNGGGVAIIDFVTGTVHQYLASDFIGPGGISGASGGGGFIHLWSGSAIYSYGGQITRQPVEYEPGFEQVPSISSEASVVPSPDGERTWIVHTGQLGDPTQVAFVNLVEEQLTRLSSFTLEGSWAAAGATVEGLVLVDGNNGRTILVDAEGAIIGEQAGRAISVGWAGAAVLRSNGSLVTTNPLLGDPNDVANPGDELWEGVGEPAIPSSSPPLRTGRDDYLVRLGTELVVVDRAGTATPIYDMGVTYARAIWSRGGDWIAVIENDVTLVAVDGSDVIQLGPLVPDEHWVLAGG